MMWHVPSEQVIKFWLFTTEGFIVRTYSNTVHKSSADTEAGAEAGRRTESDSEIGEKYVGAVLFNRCQRIIWSERSVWNIQYTYDQNQISAVPLLKYFEYPKYLNIFSFINHIFCQTVLFFAFRVPCSNFKNSDVRTFKSVLHVSTRVLCERILGEVDDDLLGEGM